MTDRRAVLLAVPLALLAACGGDGPTRQEPVLPQTPPPVAALRCVATVATAEIACEEPRAATGAAADRRLVGGQGTYVRLTSGTPTYAAGVFSFAVTVQNLSQAPMATADGTTRHEDGVRVFFHAGPAAVTGTGTITVANATGTETFTATNQPFLQYGGTVGGSPQPELGADGILSPGETSSARTWQMNVPATVTTFDFTVYVAAEVQAGALQTIAPQVSAVSPTTLVPGQSATLTGVNFDATAANNAVTVGGVAATVTAASPTSLTITVPCVATGSRDVQVSTLGRTGAPVAHPVQGSNVRTLAPGESVVLTDSLVAPCTELAPANGPAEYLVAVYNTSTTATSTAQFQIAGDGGAPEGVPAAASRAPRPGGRAAVLPLEAQLQMAREREADRLHHDLLLRNRAELVRLRAEFGSDARLRARRSVAAADPVEPPLTREFRVANILGSGLCTNSFGVTANRVYYNGKIAIYEDTSVAVGLRAANNATMAGYYQAIGDQFNADMEPIIGTYFGDVLRRDAITDNNGVLIALFTPIINNQFSGVAGFIVSCDLFPNAPTNTSSNFGEVFYARVPTSTAAGFGSNTAASWYWSIRATFIHETKHVSSYVARVANGTGNFETSWLEEGTARHSEEVWARNTIYNVAWKGNTGYGSAGAPGSIYCDQLVTDAACNATNPRRPSLNVFRHVSSLYNYLVNSRTYSAFGGTSADVSSNWYATSWSLVRYAADRYGASDEGFLTALNQASTTGMTNLAARAGVSAAELQGRWHLSLYADDWGTAPVDGNPDLQFPTWNLTDIYAGLNAQFGGSYPRSYPLIPTALPFGPQAAVNPGSVNGGGAVYYTFSGNQTQAQVIRLTGPSGGRPSGVFRVAIARLQ